jgi:hypothetical protein
MSRAPGCVRPGHAAGSVRAVQHRLATAPSDRDTEPYAWLTVLRGNGPDREAAARLLHALLLRAARFALARRRGMLDGRAVGYNARRVVQDSPRRAAQVAHRDRSRLMTSQFECMLTGRLGSAGQELICERCFELLDQYVEHELSGRAADQRIPGMREHLQACPACAGERASLRDLLQTGGTTI